MSTVLTGAVRPVNGHKSRSSSSDIDPNDLLHGDVKESDVKVTSVDGRDLNLGVPRANKKFWSESAGDRES